ncbi:MAG TPA: rod shape-determining protein MreC [Thermoleophilaceae bacterium]|nr:rod shape-determining protein MreC [Thermoleophilaceae bacterium]
MLTVYFGEGGGGVFHTMQRGAQEAFAPLETGTGRALKPFRDLLGWFGDTLDAKGENEELRAEVERLRRQVGVAETARHDVRELRGIVGLTESEGYPQGTEPVGARVIQRSPTVWYSTIKIDKGSGDGVRRDQPVVAAGGLVGVVSDVTGGTAEVTLITDSSSAVSAQVMPNGATGIVHPVVGDPDDLLLDYIADGRRVTEGTTVVTSGFESDGVESLFPRGIAIGRVTKVDPEEVEQFQRVHLEPFADIRGIDYVQVLTERGVSTQAGVPLQ